MKILRRDGQKVLEAPINSDGVIVFNNKLTIDLTTVDKQTKYIILFDAADVAELNDIFNNLDGVLT